MTPPTPYPELNAILRELIDGMKGLLSNNFVGAYLQGSFAVGDFDADSDVDFVVVTENDLTNAQVRALQELHPRIYNLASEWAKHLEGSYVLKAVLRDINRSGEPLWYLDHGSQNLIRSNHCNTLVVRSTVREHGVVLAGPAAAALLDPVPVEHLRHEIRDVITGWWNDIRSDPESINNRFYQGFVVLNYCRMLHDLHTGAVGSKRAGANWAKRTLDPLWAGLIDRAWTCRPNPAVSVRQPADPDDFQLTLEFIQYMVGLSVQTDA